MEEGLHASLSSSSDHGVPGLQSANASHGTSSGILCDGSASSPSINLEVTGESLNPVTRPKKKSLAIFRERTLGQSRKRNVAENSQVAIHTSEDLQDHLEHVETVGHTERNAPWLHDSMPVCSWKETSSDEHMKDSHSNHLSMQEILPVSASYSGNSAIMDKLDKMIMEKDDVSIDEVWQTDDVLLQEDFTDVTNALCRIESPHISGEILGACDGISKAASGSSIVCNVDKEGEEFECIEVQAGASSIELASDLAETWQNDNHAGTHEKKVANEGISCDNLGSLTMLQGTQSLCGDSLHKSSFTRSTDLPVATGPDSFLHNIKEKSKSRLQTFELPITNSDSSVDTLQQFKKELELIQKLDAKLQQMEPSDGRSSCSFQHLSPDGISTAVVYLRDERKRRERKRLIKRALDKLDLMQMQNDNNNRHLLRNIRLGPSARYFTLTPEEESLVDELLLRPDFVEDDMPDGNSTTSCISMGFDIEGEEALRMAEIDEKLEQFIEIHSACGTPSLTSVAFSIPKSHSVFSQDSNEVIETPSFSSYTNHQGTETRLGKNSFASSVEDYLAEKKGRREHQAKVEVSECMKEQNLEMTMRPSMCIEA